MEQTVDWRGTPLEVGSKIVYPVRKGSSLWMQEAVVTEILPVFGGFMVKAKFPSERWKGANKEPYTAHVTLTSTWRVTVVG